MFSMVLSSLGAYPLAASAAEEGKVRICHATSSNSNPYVSQSPNIQNNGDLSGGHLNHTGGVYPTEDWGDIIPPYSNGDFNYPGMNWTTEGQAIYNNDCNVEGEVEEPEDGIVHILKYIDGEMATDGEESANGASFPMITPTFDNAPFTLDSNGWTAGDNAYEASTNTMSGGSTYSAYENTDTDLVGDSCREGKPYALVGYSTGATIDEAEENDTSTEMPEVTVDGDMYIIVWNEKCEDEGEEEPTMGHIVVNKVTNPSADPTNFTFTTTGTGYVGFNLTDQGAMNDQTLNPGTYSVAETSVTGWTQTSATCVSSKGDTETIGNISLQAGETVTCTFTNTKNDSLPDEVTVTVVKYIDAETNIPATASNTNNSTFSLTSTWTAENLNGGVETSGNFSLGPVTYSATTSLMTSGADYSVVENDMDTECTVNNENEYILVGYKLGNTESEALASPTVTTASLTDITTNKYIIVLNELCGEVLSDNTVKVHIHKYLGDSNASVQIPDDSAAPAFTMTATWTADNLNSGLQDSGNYSLGTNHGGAALKYSAETTAMASGADYTTSEVVDGTVVVANTDSCAAGKYYLVGYKSSTLSLNDAQSQTTTLTAPSFTNLQEDAHVIVVNKKCPDAGNGTPESDLEIEKSVNNDSPEEGDDITYTLTITNNGPNAATGVTVTESLPSDLTYISHSTATGTYTPGTGIWNIGNLAVDATVTLTIVFDVESDTEGNTIVNTASVGGNETDGDTSNNTDSVTIEVDENGGGGGSSSNNSSSGSSRRRSSGSNSNDNPEGRVLGAQTSNPDDELPVGRVLGAQIGLPLTGTGNSTMNLIIMALSLAVMLSSGYLNYKSNKKNNRT